MSLYNDTNGMAAGSAYPDPINALIRRMYILLEDGNFESADGCCEKILDAYPECAEAYLGKLMIEHGARTPESLCESKTDFSRSVHFERLMQFSSDEMKNRILPVACEWVYRYSIGILNQITKIDCTDNLNKIMQNVGASEQLYDVAICQLSRIPEYKNADSILEECSQERYDLKNNCIYEHAKHLAGKNDYDYHIEAIDLLGSIGDWKDSQTLREKYIGQLDGLKEKKDEDLKRIQDACTKQFDSIIKKKNIITCCTVVVNFGLIFALCSFVDLESFFGVLVYSAVIFLSSMLLATVSEVYSTWQTKFDKWRGIFNFLTVACQMAIIPILSAYIFDKSEDFNIALGAFIVISVIAYFCGLGVGVLFGEKISNR